MNIQLALPGVDLRRCCSLCGRQALLGQWSPRQKRVYLCAECSREFAYNPRAWEDGETDDLRELRTQYVGAEWALLKRLPSRYVLPARKLSNVHIRQLSIPLCKQCGQAHAHWRLYDYAELCQPCEDRVNADVMYGFWRKIYPNLDIEDMLDKAFQSFRELFDRGVLPGRWYELMLSDLVQV